MAALIASASYNVCRFVNILSENRNMLLLKAHHIILGYATEIFPLKESFHPKMEIITYDNAHMLLDYHDYDAHKIQTCMITEPNMVITFTDFIQNLANYHFVYTQDETAEMLQDSIHKLKEALSPSSEQTFLIFEKKH